MSLSSLQFCKSFRNLCFKQPIICKYALHVNQQFCSSETALLYKAMDDSLYCKGEEEHLHHHSSWQSKLLFFIITCNTIIFLLLFVSFPFFFSLPHLFIFKTLSLSFSCLFKQHHRMNLIKNPIWVLFLKPRKQTPLKMAEVASNCLFLFFLQLLTLCASGKQLVSTLS